MRPSCLTCRPDWCWSTSTEAPAIIQFCVSAANALLAAARQLADEPPHLLPPKERAQRVKELIHETKVAGRAAYRAALTLAGQEWKEE